MINKIKNSLSQIVIAVKLKKKIVKFKVSKYNKAILDILWIEGFIYGYSKTKKNYFKVFLKYSERGFCLLKNLVFCSKSIHYSKLTNLLNIEKNLYVFMITEKGFFFITGCLKNRLGGFIILKN